MAFEQMAPTLVRPDSARSDGAWLTQPDYSGTALLGSRQRRLGHPEAGYRRPAGWYRETRETPHGGRNGRLDALLVT
jgi:hypothetical protein